KEVVEFSVIDTSKGDALEALARASAADAWLYLGDDVTDESVFARLGDDDMGVKVGGGDTSATHRITGTDDARHLLETLVRARRELGCAGAGAGARSACSRPEGRQVALGRLRPVAVHLVRGATVLTGWTSSSRFARRGRALGQPMLASGRANVLVSTTLIGALRDCPGCALITACPGPAPADRAGRAP